MANMEDGGPAFPLQEQFQSSSADCSGWLSPGQSGMTLRDWFAGQAITKFIPCENDDKAAAWAYRVADAMLIRRKE